MSYWQVSRGDWKIRKPASFLSHLQAGILIAVIPPLILSHPSTQAWQIWEWIRHPVTWAGAAILAGLAWEWGYYFVVAKVLPQAPRIEFIDGYGLPKLGRKWEVRVRGVGSNLLGGDKDKRYDYSVLLIMHNCPDRALPRAFDMVPFILGAGLGLWFTVWRLG